MTLWEQIVDSVDAANGGPYPGYRSIHAKGTVCGGTFTATPEAKSLSRAAHLQGDEVKTTVRFSNASGNPHTSDANPLAGRGMAVKFHLPDGEATDMGAVPLVVFMVRNADDFLAFTGARKPDPETGQPNPEKVMAFIGEHPETANAIQLSLPKLAPTVSFATSAYNGLHAFCLVDADDGEHWGRYRWIPAEGEQYLGDEDRDAAAPDYLQEEIKERLGSGTVEFTLEFVLAADGDSLTDPTEEWQGDREVVPLGTLTVTGVTDEPTDGPLVFDPNNLTDGIKASDDEILAARSPAYSVSIDRRAAVRPPHLGAQGEARSDL